MKIKKNSDVQFISVMNVGKNFFSIVFFYSVKLQQDLLNM